MESKVDWYLCKYDHTGHSLSQHTHWPGPHSSIKDVMLDLGVRFSQIENRTDMMLTSTPWLSQRPNTFFNNMRIVLKLLISLEFVKNQMAHLCRQKKAANTHCYQLLWAHPSPPGGKFWPFVCLPTKLALAFFLFTHHLIRGVKMFFLVVDI